MKKLSFILFIAFISFAACCDKNTGEKTTLEINFKATFGADPLVLYQDYSAPNGDDFELRTFKFFLSDVRLIKDNGDEVLVTESDYVNFNSISDLTTAQNGISLNFTDIPVGTYTSIHLGIGVSPELNAQIPSDFTTAQALGNPSNYWTSWNSYTFSELEGEIDTLAAASGGKITFLYHAGVDGMYQSRYFSKSINLAADQSNTINFTIDSRDFFYKNGAEIDIPAMNVSHSGDPQTEAYTLSKTVITNIADAISIQ